jgi:surface antigen
LGAQRLAVRLTAPALVLALGLPAGGCSLSWQLESLSKKDEVEATGSITPAKASSDNDLPSAADLAYARAAASDVLTRGRKDASQPWENPRTGARGTVTPIATSYTNAGFTCRDFLASYVLNGTESWMQGEACRLHQGKWEVRNLKPWKRSS